MNDQSQVSLEQHACLVCGTAFDTGAILLDKRLRASMERHTATGWGLCSEHQKLSDDGFVALVECDPQRSGSQAGDRMKPEQAYCTGRMAHLRRAVFAYNHAWWYVNRVLRLAMSLPERPPAAG